MGSLHHVGRAHPRRAGNKCLTPRVGAFKLIAASVVFALAAPTAAAAYSTAALREKDVKKAEKLIAKLRRLEEVTAHPLDLRAYGEAIEGLYPGLFVGASELREGDLKTDLTTAAFLHRSAYRNWTTSAARMARCDREVRGVYMKLCFESRDGNPARLLLSKARLHTKWAEAVVRSYRGAADQVTAAQLAELEAERKVDLVLAGRAVEALKKLGERIEGYSSLEAFDEAGRGGRLTFGQLSEEISRELAIVDHVVAALPRGPLHLLLDNARGSYRDGLFWWEKSHGAQRKTVSANNLAAADPLKVIDLPEATVNNAVLANWRHALRYTKEAEGAIAAGKS